MNLFNEKLEARVKPGSGRGLFAVDPLSPGEIIAVWGVRITTVEEFHTLPEPVRKLSLQIEEDFFLVLQGGENGADYINHSCQPNAGMAGQIVVTAMRFIARGEEICYDYAMTDGGPCDEFECCCGSVECRGKVTGGDWQRPELWTRYEGYFSPYLARRIQRIKSAQSNGRG